MTVASPGVVLHSRGQAPKDEPGAVVLAALVRDAEGLPIWAEQDAARTPANVCPVILAPVRRIQAASTFHIPECDVADGIRPDEEGATGRKGERSDLPSLHAEGLCFALVHTGTPRNPRLNDATTVEAGRANRVSIAISSVAIARRIVGVVCQLILTWEKWVAISPGFPSDSFFTWSVSECALAPSS
jgi:hypothetical protein